MKHRLSPLVGVGSALALAPAICQALAFTPLLPTPSAAQDRPLTVNMTEVYRAGGVNAPDWALFGPAAALQASFDGAGNLLLLDAFNKRVVVVGPDGQLVRIVGREGEGPGEFQEVRALAVWRDGRFAVPDTEHSAIQVFSPDGELERFVRWPGEPRTLSTALRHREIRADPLGDRIVARGVEGVLVEMMSFGNRLQGYPEDDTEGVDDRALEMLDLSGDVIASVPVLQGWRAPRPEPPSSTSLDDWPKIVAAVEDRYFEPTFHWDVLPDGTIAYSDSTAYAVKLASPDGSVTDVLRRLLSPETVSERIRQGTIAFRLQRLEESLANPPSTSLPFGRDPEQSRRTIRDREFYHEVPVVQGIRATWDGGLWIQRRSENPWDDEGPIDVFDADREYVGTLSAGEPAMPIAFGPDGLVAHMESDEFDVPTLVVSRVER
ncbi:MAG: hypothetical protein OXU74_00235 [Gemmatimonadota bacterium]|nr:hypothetical protein [Gemmatimonadota bacterium]